MLRALADLEVAHLPKRPHLLLGSQRVPVGLRLPLPLSTARPPLWFARRQSTRDEWCTFRHFGPSKTAWLSHAPGTIRTCGLCLRLVLRRGRGMQLGWYRATRLLPHCAPAAPPMCKDGGLQRILADWNEVREGHDDACKRLNHPCSDLVRRRGWDSNPRVTLTTTAGFQDLPESGQPWAFHVCARQLARQPSRSNARPRAWPTTERWGSVRGELGVLPAAVGAPLLRRVHP